MKDNKENNLCKQRKADLMLLAVTAFWGLSYLGMDVALNELDNFMLNVFRFLGGGLVTYLLLFSKMRRPTKKTLGYAFLVGVSLFGCYYFVTVGVQLTSLSNAGFFCALAVVFVPIINFVLFKKRPGKKLLVVVILCTVGIALLSLKGGEMSLNKGDFFCILCALSYAADTILCERAVKDERVDAMQLGVFSLIFCGLIFLLLAALTGTIAMPATGGVWVAVVFLALFCTAFAFVLQPIAQQYTTAAHVGVIFTMEPVFAGVAAFLIAKEVLTPQGYVGAALMIGSILLMESNIGKNKNQGSDDIED